MSIELADAYISLIPSAKGMKGHIEKELGGAGASAARSTESAFRASAGKVGGFLKSALKGAAIAGGAAFAGAVVGAKASIDAASDLAEAQSKVEAVFGDSATSIKDWAAGSAKAFGQSKEQALSAAGAYGNLFSAFGLGEKETQSMSTGLTELAADLASFNNTSIDEALESLQSGVSGETEPLKKYGIAINDVRLKEQARAMGLKVGAGPLDAATKAQATYALIMQDTKKAQGDFARTSDGLANKQRILGAQFTDMKAKIGGVLLPVVLRLATVFTDSVLPVIERHLPGALAAAKGAIASLTPVIQSVAAWLQQNVPPAIETARAAFAAIVEWVRANWPQIRDVISQVLGTVRTVIEGAVSVITTLWQNFGDNILTFVQRAWGPIKQIIEGALRITRGVIQTVTSLIKGDWSGVWEGIKGIVSGVWSAIQGIVKAALEAVRLAIGVVLEVIGSVWKAAWNGIRDFVSARVSDVVGFVTGIPGRISSTVSTLWDGIMTGIGIAKQFVSDRVDEVVGFITGLPDKIATTASGMFDGIKDAFRSALNWIIDAWNGLEFKIPGFDPPGPGPKFDGFTLGMPDLPRFHTGGVVGRSGSAREVLAMLEPGEVVLSRAAVANLSRYASVPPVSAGSLQAGGNTFHVAAQSPRGIAAEVDAINTWTASVKRRRR